MLFRKRTLRLIWCVHTTIIVKLLIKRRAIQMYMSYFKVQRSFSKRIQLHNSVILN